jgi:uncharacterized protein (DUF1330 family)
VVLLFAGLSVSTEDEVMKTRYVAALSMLAGVAIGAVSGSGLYAQNKAPGAYVVVTFTDIGDEKAFMENVGNKAPPVVTKHGGHFIVRTNQFTVLQEGPTPFPLKRYVVIGFDSVDAAKAWYNSEDMKGINAYNSQHTKGRTYVVPAYQGG